MKLPILPNIEPNDLEILKGMVNEGLSDSRFSLGLEYEPKNQIEPLLEMAQRYLNQSNGDPFDLINDEGIQTLLRTPELIRIIDFNSLS